MIEGISPSLLFVILAGWVSFWIFVIILRKIRGRGKMKVLVLKHNLKYQVRQEGIDENKLKMGKDWKPTFEPTSVFEEEKAFWKIWRLPYRLILIVDKASKALGWKKENEEEFSELAQQWTKKEIRKLIKREVARALTSVKPMSLSMFFFLMIPQVIMLFLMFLLLNRMGIV